MEALYLRKNFFNIVCRQKANNNLNKLKDLMIAKKSWLDKLRGKIVKMEGHKKRDKVMKNNSIFQKVEGSF